MLTPVFVSSAGAGVKVTTDAGITVGVGETTGVSVDTDVRVIGGVGWGPPPIPPCGGVDGGVAGGGGHGVFGGCEWVGQGAGGRGCVTGGLGHGVITGGVDGQGVTGFWGSGQGVLCVPQLGGVLWLSV